VSRPATQVLARPAGHFGEQLSPTDPSRGLTAAEAAARAARGLANRLPRSGGAEYRAIVARNLLTPFNALVVPAAAALFLLGDLRGAWAVSGMAAVNALLGLAQEVRAKRHLDRLDLLSETRARVVRDGAEHLVPAGDVVRGDVIRLVAGEPVVADGAVLTATFLEVDEALLTGESDPVPRRPGEQLLSGSFAVAGEGVYRADAVGASASAHQTSAAARQYRHAPSPVQRTLDSLIRVLTAAALGLCGVYVVLYFVRDLPTTDLVQMVAATVTSLVPQGLVLMTTLALTLGAVRLASRGAVVQRLAAVEAMASVDVLCADKTGTVTTSNLTVDRVDVLADDEVGVRAMLRLFAWATTDEGNRSVQALRSIFPKPDEPFSPIDQVPFKSQNRFSAVRVRTAGGEAVLVLGSPDALIPRLAGEAAGRVEARFRELLPSGLRLLAFAVAAPTPEVVTGPLAKMFGDGQRTDKPLLRPLALVGLRDELRPGVDRVIESLAAQGVGIKLLSGDHPDTVRATVSRLDLPLARGPVRTGADLEASPDRDALIAETAVFGRVTPRQKLDIITALQARGRRVAMIGDGVNDVLSIKTADLGVAMGAGNPAAKTVAGLVLETNSFDLLPAALAEGRTVLHNVRRAAKLFLLKNVYTLLLIVVLVGLLGEAFPYLPQQVTLLNALTIGGPAVLIMLSKVPPGAAVRAAFLPEVGRFALGMGLALGGGGLAVWHLGDGAAERRTLLLSTLVLAGLGNAVFIGGAGQRMLGWAVLAGLAYLTAMYVGPAAYFFALTPLAAGQWAAVVVAAAGGFSAGWLVTRRQTEIDHQRQVVRRPPG
jgi:cation-transporting ATPase E